MKFFVVSDHEDPGSEHDSLEEAQAIVNDLQEKGCADARIIPYSGMMCESEFAVNFWD